MKIAKSIIVAVILFTSLFAGCTTTKPINTIQKEVGIRKKTQNPNTPYIYKNGYKNFEIVPVLSVIENDSTYMNELRFNAVSSASYTQKLMYDKFGIWDIEVWHEETKRFIFVWESRKLLDNQNELFTVAATGIESWENMFASVNITDSNHQDCLSENAVYKDALVSFFANQIRNLSDDNSFYKLKRSRYLEIKSKK